ncbi:integrator complex subunit 12 isoform X2 [Cephus cinctus]|uniref:Integrator complex subunit 12 n=1 Tax=Cephus cinctus TaxID=211228 RepID=A0AAJ7FUL5_CEPCN|nr:integrator complex subunit 12 isoform X2 [Cephus cinctus]
MYSSDLDNSSDIEEEFISALTLLRSTDVDSAEKLRRMLDHSIERKLGHRRFLTTKDFLEDNRNYEEIQRDDRNSRNSSPEEFILADSVMVLGVQEVEDEFCEKIDIPRISIPDEGPAEGALCKICNSAKLGPLILLECQECQEVYHPLCHQPPVLDIDVYDPRLVWRCNKCEETSNSNKSYMEINNAPEETDKQDELKDQKVIKEVTRKRISKDPLCFTANKLKADDSHGKERRSLRPVKDSTIKSRKRHSSILQKSSSTFQGVSSQLRKRFECHAQPIGFYL